VAILQTILREGKLDQHPDDIPFDTGPIVRLTTNEPIDDYIGDMLRAARCPTPLEEVAEAIFSQVYRATGDLFAAWEAMSRIYLAGADKLDEVQAVIEAEEPMAFELPLQYFEDMEVN
jgi:hypothetical protein